MSYCDPASGADDPVNTVIVTLANAMPIKAALFTGTSYKRDLFLSAGKRQISKRKKVKKFIIS